MDAFPTSFLVLSARRGFARRVLTLVAGLAGTAVLAGLVLHAGPARLAQQLHALGPLLPLLLVLTGVRYFLQAAGWRLALTPAARPGWGALVNAVIVGEAIGYVAWGPIAREPAKALFLGSRVPARVALTAAIAERAVFVAVATMLALVAVSLLAAHGSLLVWVAAAIALVVVVALGRRWWRARQTSPAERVDARLDVARDLWHRRPAALVAMSGLALVQEAINVLEAYLIFVWLGASPTVTAALVFEGLSRFVNAAGQFVPGRVGVYEGASALLADALSLGASFGVSLALARRTRSLMWAVPGALLLAHRGYHRTIRGVGRPVVAPAPIEVQA